MEEPSGSFWPLAVLIFVVAAAVIGGIWFYPREQKVVSELTGMTGLFENGKNNTSTRTQMTAILHTNQGDITIELYPDEAPSTVANFVKLAQDKFYDGTLFHRVIKGFMIQGGDPLSREKDWRLHGTGGPGYKFNDEQNDLRLERGVIAMANSGPNTNGSQFFIMTAREPLQLQGYYTAFGRVAGSFEAVDKIEGVPTDRERNDHPTVDMVITSVEIK